MTGQDHGSRPAFPFMHELPDGFGSETVHAPGMTIRVYLAGQALVGYLAFNPGGEPVSQSDPAVAARKAVEFADALLAELAKPDPQDRR